MSAANTTGPMIVDTIIEGRKAIDVFRCKVPDQAEGFNYVEKTQLKEFGLEFSVILLTNGEYRTSLVRVSDRIGAGVKMQATQEFALKHLKTCAITVPAP